MQDPVPTPAAARYGEFISNNLAISSTRILTDSALVSGTVVVRDGRIAEVLSTTSHPGAIDIGDAVLMPGVVDTHVHVNEPGRTDWEGFRSAGRAAAAGGITSIVVMPLNCTPAATTAAALLAEAATAKGECAVDYGFWGGVVPGNTSQLEPLWNNGVLGFKCFLSPSGVDDFGHVSEQDLNEALPVLARLGDNGAVLLVHAEDPDTLAAARAASGLDTHPHRYASYLASRPAAAEERAVSLLLRVARKHKSRLHIVHVSSPETLRAIVNARRNGFAITSETCPHYLAFASEEVTDKSTLFKCAPPIRTRKDRDRLWTALRAGSFDLIASDHSPCPPDLKCLETGDFAQAWGGISSLQLSLSVVWSHASWRGFALTDVAQWMCAGPARLAGLDGRKGRIAPGYDADLVIFSPEREFVVQGPALEHRHKATPYHGATLRGVVEATYIRGQQVFKAGTFGAEATGQWLKRTAQ